MPNSDENVLLNPIYLSYILDSSSDKYMHVYVTITTDAENDQQLGHAIL